MGVKTLVRLAFVFSVFWIGTQGHKCYECNGADCNTADDKFLNECDGPNPGCAMTFAKLKDNVKATMRICVPGVLDVNKCKYGKGPAGRKMSIKVPPGGEGLLCACAEDGCNKHEWTMELPPGFSYIDDERPEPSGTTGGPPPPGPAGPSGPSSPGYTFGPSLARILGPPILILLINMLFNIINY